jgi:CheY-like chemotaxis protein
MGKKILLADDSLTIQKVVELTFSDSEYELVCVSNGQKALEKVREERPDLILADVVMPEKNGYEVCEAIKGDPATARIPVVLLSGTFEPFDRERAERIGADAIVSKPFDSQQLLAQVEALLDRVPPSTASAGVSAELAGGAPSPEITGRIPTITEPTREEAPFDVGFATEDFTASIRVAPRREGIDPFEEEYGRVDVDSAIEAFEKSQPQFTFGAEAPEPDASVSDAAPSRGLENPAREPLAQWLREEPERPAGEPETAAGSAFAPAFDADPAATVSLRSLDASPGSTLEVPQETVAMKIASPTEPKTEEISEEQAKALFDVAPPPPAPPIADTQTSDTSGEGASRTGTTAEVPREIEELAQTSSIPELTQMLSSVARPSGNDLTEEQIERLAARVVEKLSDRIVREIAWEVIPDMAEIVIKQRIKELEAGVE